MASPLAQLKRDIAIAGQILSAAGHADSLFGHVSGRLPGRDSFWIKPAGKGMDEISVDDLLHVGFDGGLIAGTGRVHREWPIHAEVFRARGSVNAVVHTHPKFGVALAAAGKRLTSLNQDAALFQPEVPELTDFAHLVETTSDGQAVARSLGNAMAVFLVNHGVVVVGQDVAAATVAALMLERACEIQLLVVTSVREATAADARTVAEARADSFRAVFEYHARSLARSPGISEPPPGIH